jgi:C4-dicarboxylate-specific signal transduction histidine kinase
MASIPFRNKLIQAAGQNSGIEIVMNLDSSLPVVTANHVQLEQVFINLLRNGIDAMLSAGAMSGALVIETHRVSMNKISASVVDRGAGIPDALKDRIFKPFFTTKKEGMGMGLAICSSIIESHGGNLYIEDYEHGGGVVGFILPVAGS